MYWKEYDSKYIQQKVKNVNMVRVFRSLDSNRKDNNIINIYIESWNIDSLFEKTIECVFWRWHCVDFTRFDITDIFIEIINWWTLSENERSCYDLSFSERFHQLRCRNVIGFRYEDEAHDVHHLVFFSKLHVLNNISLKTINYILYFWTERKSRSE